MQARVLFIVGTIALLVLQITVAPLIEIGKVRPDLYVLFVVFLVNVMPSSAAMTAAFALGLVRDLTIAAAPVGVDAFALLCAAGVLTIAHRRFLLESDLSKGAAAILGALIHGAVWAMALAVSTGDFFRLILFTAAPVALYTGACMPLFAYVARRLLNEDHRRRRPVRQW